MKARRIRDLLITILVFYLSYKQYHSKTYSQPIQLNCRRCGSPMIYREVESSLSKVVKGLTGQEKVLEWLCPKCYPKKVVSFINRKKD